MLRTPAAFDVDPDTRRSMDSLLDLRHPTLDLAPPCVSDSPISPEAASSVTEALTDRLTSSIVDAYERHLKFTPEGCRWASEGRTLFTKTVSHFVALGEAVEFVLPAFPCKSSNLNKVSGALPDKGEELALRTLKLFSNDVASFYAPGVLVRVVSDGHVFSDLVGTDDAAVDDYNAALKDMATGIDARIVFAGLDELIAHIPDAPAGDIPTTGPLATKHTPEADAARATLLELYGQPPTSTDERLANDQALLGLCRGFSRFVFEDTLQHPSMKAMSQSKRKRVAWSTAKLMILRNEAYSRLVEVCFPSAVRLSIHPYVPAPVRLR